MAAAGSAVGLGNIWKFPYVAGENGGGAFLLVYLVCVLLFGMPLIMMEFYIGKRTGKSAYGAFRALSGNNRWQWLSWLCLTTAVVIMGFYFVVTGWCFSYLAEALAGRFSGMDTEALTAHFTSLTTNTPRMIFFSLLPVVLTALILLFSINKGIERASKILMPLLLLMMVLMVGRVLMLDGSNIGLRFFLHADFSKITPRVVLEAMGQSFFSLSIGMGALITYGAYMPPKQNVPRASLQVVVLDTLVAFMAGLIVFPAVFAFGCNPAEGPQLVFVVLPVIFQQMSLPWVSSVLFFALLGIAALTSTISLMEVGVAFIREATAPTKYPLGRRMSVCMVTGVTVLMVLLCVFIPRVFSSFDAAVSCVLMPLGALGMAVLVGQMLSRQSERDRLIEKGYKPWTVWTYGFMLRGLVPTAILLIFLKGLGVF